MALTAAQQELVDEGAPPVVAPAQPRDSEAYQYIPPGGVPVTASLTPAQQALFDEGHIASATSSRPQAQPSTMNDRLNAAPAAIVDAAKDAYNSTPNPLTPTALNGVTQWGNIDRTANMLNSGVGAGIGAVNAAGRVIAQEMPYQVGNVLQGPQLGRDMVGLLTGGLVGYGAHKGVMPDQLVPPAPPTAGLTPHPTLTGVMQTPDMVADATPKDIALGAALRADPRTAPQLAAVDNGNQAAMVGQLGGITHPVLRAAIDDPSGAAAVPSSVTGAAVDQILGQKSSIPESDLMQVVRQANGALRTPVGVDPSTAGSVKTVLKALGNQNDGWTTNTSQLSGVRNVINDQIDKQTASKSSNSNAAVTQLTGIRDKLDLALDKNIPGAKAVLDAHQAVLDQPPVAAGSGVLTRNGVLDANGNLDAAKFNQFRTDLKDNGQIGPNGAPVDHPDVQTLNAIGDTLSTMQKNAQAKPAPLGTEGTTMVDRYLSGSPHLAANLFLHGAGVLGQIGAGMAPNSLGSLIAQGIGGVNTAAQVAKNVLGPRARTNMLFDNNRAVNALGSSFTRTPPTQY